MYINTCSVCLCITITFLSTNDKWTQLNRLGVWCWSWTYMYYIYNSSIEHLFTRLLYFQSCTFSNIAGHRVSSKTAKFNTSIKRCCSRHKRNRNYYWEIAGLTGPNDKLIALYYLIGADATKAPEGNNSCRVFNYRPIWSTRNYEYNYLIGKPA